jgi:hypothetical protein
MAVLGNTGKGVTFTGTFEWYGNRLTDHMRGASILSLKQAGEQMVEVAQTYVNVQTQALHDSIRAEVARSSPGSGVYRLVFGVWDHPNNKIRNWDGRMENPADYAYFQETQPDRGKPFLRPAVDEVAPNLSEFLRANLPRLDARGLLDFGTTGALSDNLGGGDGGAE